MLKTPYPKHRPPTFLSSLVYINPNFFDDNQRRAKSYRIFDLQQKLYVYKMSMVIKYLILKFRNIENKKVCKNIRTLLKFHLSKSMMPETSERSDSSTWSYQYHWCLSFHRHIKVWSA